MSPFIIRGKTFPGYESLSFFVTSEWFYHLLLVTPEWFYQESTVLKNMDASLNFRHNGGGGFPEGLHHHLISHS